MMATFVQFLSRLWDHWQWLTGLLLMVEPLIDYYVAGFRDWADKYVPRQTRTRVAVTVSAVTVLVGCFLAFDDEYSAWRKDEEAIHGKDGYEQRLASLNGKLSDAADKAKDQDSAINGHDGYKAQIAELEKQLGKVGSDLTFIQREKPQVVVQTKEVPVVIPSGAQQMTPEQEQRVKNIRVSLAALLNEGIAIDNDLTDPKNADAEKKANEWANRVEEYLRKNLDDSYIIRFRDSSGAPQGMTTAPIAEERQRYWFGVSVRNFRLNQFITELSR